jgi:putative peptidoglycan lipid II flippase
VAVSAIGYLRESALAARFGVSTTMDAYFAAIFIPNILYFVLIAGTVSPVFIPILLKEGGHDRAKQSETFSIVTSFALLVLLVIVTCALPGAYGWLSWLFPGFSPNTLEMAARLIFVILPAVLFLAVAGILTAVLNGYHKFALAAFAPAIASAVVIAAIFFARGESAIYTVGIATSVGFFLQCLVLVPATAALGIRYRLILNFRHPAIRKLLRMGIPLFLYLAVGSSTALLERNLASRLSAGAVSMLTYAQRLFSVPANFLAAPLAIVAYPGFAREAARVARGELSSQVSRLFRLIIFLFLPTAVWTIINALFITRLLYEHGRFLPTDSFITARVLSIYSLAILPNAIALVLLRCYFAVEDTVTPLCAEILALVSFAIVGPLMSRHFGITGLVSARTGTFFLVTTLLIYILAQKKDLLTFGAGFPVFMVKTAAASVGMGLMSWLGLLLARGWFDSGNALVRLLIVGILLAFSGAIYLGLARLMKLSEARQIWTAVFDLLPGGDRSQ